MINIIRLALLVIVIVGFGLVWWQSNFWLALGVLLIALAAAVHFDPGQ